MTKEELQRLRDLSKAAEGSGQCVCVNPSDMLGLLDVVTTMARAVHALQVINHEQRKLLDSTICSQGPIVEAEWLRVSRVLEGAQAVVEGSS
ncbi:hypothetical protein JQN63_11185 [Delftia lacustris]|jgi:hypothetical protein|uniref:hypothetical protein n=1 Tax=Delftia TaxID=80865 RepID=UPI000F82E482|nr:MULTISPECIES: hypothetical protein [Delftia]MDH0847436.1 hypothetical protein [Delftia tsuruhatensis]QRI92404.1 hypothetical protein JQN63_10725 [Delftia lacustris]QRI92483.1 hypothetical protein JQN63_11185 [Delftia lacustris]BDE70867.1 hypothetical protein HQS1_19910 [Delftia lacustris]